MITAVYVVLRSQCVVSAKKQKETKNGNSNYAILQGQRTWRARPHGTVFPESQMAAQGGAGEMEWLTDAHRARTRLTIIIIQHTDSKIRLIFTIEKKGWGIGFSMNAKRKHQVKS